MTVSPGLETLLARMSGDIDKELQKMHKELKDHILKELGQRFNGDFRDLQRLLMDILRLQQNQQASALSGALQSSIDTHFGKNMLGGLLQGVVSQNSGGQGGAAGQNGIRRPTPLQLMLSLGGSIAKSQNRNG
jgi:hypothetical protein